MSLLLIILIWGFSGMIIHIYYYLIGFYDFTKEEVIFSLPVSFIMGPIEALTIFFGKTDEERRCEK